MRKNEGITLIALVITIIVLLVLAGVSINVLTGENGILTKVTQAKEENQNASIKEKIKIAVMESIGNEGNLEYDTLKDNLGKIENISGVPQSIDGSSFPIVLQNGESYIHITECGEVEEIKLPKEYQEVGYIESSGTQYIDTVFIPNQDTSIETKIQYTNKANSNSAIFGTRNNVLVNSYTTMLSSNDVITDSKFYSGYGSDNYESSLSGSYEVFKIKKSKNEFYINNNLIYSQPIQTFLCPKSLVLFACYNVNIVEYCASLKMYYTKIWDNGTLVRNFVPCYNVQTNEVGMYDTINSIFYTNVGTGEFIKGNDV